MSIQIYPVQKQAEHYDGYRVKINGEWVTVDTARVSALPFNRRWPGYQRQIEQSKLANFLSFGMEGSVELEIFPKEKVSEWVIRPRSLELTPEMTEHGSVKIKLEHPAYFTLSPKGDDDALHIFADPIKEYHPEGEVIYFGEGIHDVGVLSLKSGQTVLIDKGAVVYGCIHADHAENIQIIGGGILDNSRNKAQIRYEVTESTSRTELENAVRLHTIQLNFCKNIVIDGITIRDSLVYNIRPIGCKNLTVSHVKIIGCWRFNSDGIDMLVCEDVHISDCFLRTFDDTICIKGRDAEMEQEMQFDKADCNLSQNILIERCTIWNDWGKCLEIGAETRAREIKNIIFRDCDIISVCGSVLDCMNVDDADVHDVIYENINVEYQDTIPKPMVQRSNAQQYVNTDADYAPYLISLSIEHHYEYSADAITRGKNRHFLFKSIRLYARQKPTVRLMGFDEEHPCSDITFDGIWHNGEKAEPILTVNEYCKNIQWI